MTHAQIRPVVQFMERLQETGGLKGTDIANFAGVSKATVSRWANGLSTSSMKTGRKR
jgi:predicted transcriptional regulator